jgi:hypothetical protein
MIVFGGPTSAATKMDFRLQTKLSPPSSRHCVRFCLRERSDEDAARKKDVERSVMTNIAPSSIAVPLLFHVIFPMEFLQRRSMAFRVGANGLAKTSQGSL